MKESYFIPESQVLPQAEVVSNWVKNSTSKFNTALRLVAKVETGTYGKEMMDYEQKNGITHNGFHDMFGHQLINGEMVLTGTGFCSEGSITYGYALLQFPFVKDLHFIDFKHAQEFSGKTKEVIKTRQGTELEYKEPEGFKHMILGFSIEKDGYFLDATYGQVAKEENSVIMDSINDFDSYYKPVPLKGRKEHTDKYVTYPFESFEDHERGAIVPPMGIESWRYMVNVLMDQPMNHK